MGSTPENSESGGRHYWAIDIPGLNHEQAMWLVSAINDRPHKLHASAVNPQVFLTLHLDRDTMLTLRAALSVAKPDKVVDGMRETLDDWLEAATLEDARED